ncbi:hypothetical protein [Xanthomonas sp. CFBP 8445]|uniref:hypothetical protein n=1 Tax=Xanthomonas sp. CFBP 8445 TaxID=2971236 RepID=UPI0021E0E9FF|nr:hypothetical protein [Xanthomonas sp. CFBP 8445]UYC14032.1 hypothetical protein NUG21_10020 [Xanthomonas sp. CFBP 8445]
MKFRLMTNVIKYRQGYVEISNIHAGCVNLEVWSINPVNELKEGEGACNELEDDHVTGNVEVELSPEGVKALINALQKALSESLDSANVSDDKNQA